MILIYFFLIYFAILFFLLLITSLSRKTSSFVGLKILLINLIDVDIVRIKTGVIIIKNQKLGDESDDVKLLSIKLWIKPVLIINAITTHATIEKTTNITVITVVMFVSYNKSLNVTVKIAAVHKALPKV